MPTAHHRPFEKLHCRHRAAGRQFLSAHKVVRSCGVPPRRRCRKSTGLDLGESLVGRYYDPATGQFLSVDPLVGKTEQAYAYTADDPVNGTDPMGLYAPNPCGQAGAQSAACGAVEQTQRHVAANEQANQVGANKPIIDIGGPIGNLAANLLAGTSTALGYVQVAADVATLACAALVALPCVAVVAAVSEVSGLAATASACLSSAVGGPSSATDACVLSLQTEVYSGGFVSGPAVQAVTDLLNWLEQGGAAGAAEPPCQPGNAN